MWHFNQAVAFSPSRISRYYYILVQRRISASESSSQHSTLTLEHSAIVIRRELAWCDDFGLPHTSGSAGATMGPPCLSFPPCPASVSIVVWMCKGIHLLSTNTTHVHTQAYARITVSWAPSATMKLGHDHA